MHRRHFEHLNALPTSVIATSEATKQSRAMFTRTRPWIASLRSQ